MNDWTYRTIGLIVYAIGLIVTVANWHGHSVIAYLVGAVVGIISAMLVQEVLMRIEESIDERTDV